MCDAMFSYFADQTQDGEPPTRAPWYDTGETIIHYEHREEPVVAEADWAIPAQRAA
jgi:hypothetical protein